MEEKNNIFEHLKQRKSAIPDDLYFEQMVKSVIASQQKAPIIPLHKRPIVWISAIAAIILVGFIVVNFTSTSTSKTDALLALNDISSKEVYQYINENIDDFDMDLIVDALNESTVDEFRFVEPDSSKIEEVKPEKLTPTRISFDEIDANDILDYFNQEGIDIEDLEDDESFI